MSRFHVRELLHILVAVALSVHGITADSGTPIVKTVGAVSINGTPAAKVSALLPRDVVQTTTDSSAAISSKGTIVRVLPNSSIVWGGVLELQAGSVAVGTDSGTAVVIETYRVVPTRKGTKFVVTRESGCSYISVQDGSVKVEEGSKDNVVSSGGTLSFGNVADHRCDGPTAMTSGGKKVITAGRAAVGIGAAGVVIGVSVVRSISPSSPD